MYLLSFSFFFATNRFLGFRLAHFVVEQPELSDSSDKSTLWAHYVSDHYREMKQILFISAPVFHLPATFFFYILFSLLSDFSLLCMPSHCEPSFLLLGSDTDLTGGPCHSSVHISYFLFAFSCSGVACFVHRVPLSSLYNWSYNFARNETTMVVCSFYLHNKV